MPQKISDFEEIKLNAESLYKSFGEVYCPFFKEKIIFNSLGIEHLKFKRYEKARLEQDQYMRFKLLYLAPEIIKQSHTLQGFQEIKKFERIRKYSRTENVLRVVLYYEFIAVIKRNRVKIVIKQIEDGPKLFWSIFPFWKMKDKTRLFFEGTPEED